MTIFDAIVQGIVQGLTEFLPVSSSGHLSITQHFLGVSESNLFFNVMLHIGTLFAVIAVYYKLFGRLIVAFFKMIKKIFTGNFKWSKMTREENMLWMLFFGLLPLFLLFVPIPFTGGLSAKDFAEIWSEDGSIMLEGFALLTTSILLTLGIRANKKTTARYERKGIFKKSGAGRTKFNPVDAVTVGITQTLAAVFPGLSRSGSTLAAGELRGINKQAALDYTFVLGTPAIVAAALLEIKDVINPPEGVVIKIELLPVIVGVITSAVVGFLAIKLFKWMLAKDRMYVFAAYTAVVGLAVVVYSMIMG
ncbi:MAG: undecaprenyl-diphosphate phosphatase [Acutalibacteraceae bacterium]